MYNYTSSSINLQQSAEKNAFDVECARIHECRGKAGAIPLSAGGVGYIFYCMSGGGELCESACFPLQSGEICLFIAGGKAVAAEETLRVGEDQSSPLVQELAFGAYNKRFAPNRTEFDWLSVNSDNVDRYIQDPLCGGNPTIGLFREMLGGLRFIAKPENLRKMNLNTPILFISGEMDPVGDCGKGVKRAYESFRKAGVRSVFLKLYPELRHEILNEDCRETVYSDILQWLNSRVPASV